MLASGGMFDPLLCPHREERADMIIRSEGATSVNDMKDMLANLPQFKEQREKVCDSLLPLLPLDLTGLHSSLFT